MKSCIHAIAIVFLAALAPAVSQAQLADQEVADLQNLGITEKRNEKIPLDLAFTDENGRSVKLDEYFSGGKPVILTLNYYSCPMLCTLQLNGLVDALSNINLVPGEDFEMITISFNPRETANLARLKKDSYVKSYRPEAARGWHFLIGEQDAIDAICEATGFTYKYIEETNEFAHAAVTMVLTPDGTLSRYLYGVFYEPQDPQTLRLTLLEAGEGKIGSPLDQVLLFCYHYDPEAGSYSLAAWNLTRGAAGLTAVLVMAFLIPFWVREYRKSRRNDPQEMNP